MTDTDYKWEKYEHTWLGCPDLPIDKDNDIYTSKIGGKPVWLTKEQVNPPPTPPSNIKCKHCKSQLYLVVQAYAPLDNVDRFLYVFGCNNSQCAMKGSGCWAAFRGQVGQSGKEETKEELKEESKEEELKEEEKKEDEKKSDEKKEEEKKNDEKKEEIKQEDTVVLQPLTRSFATVVREGPEDIKLKEKQAEEEKEKGNKLYNLKQFDEALSHYDKAMELNPQNPVYRMNRAAVFLETGRFDDCIQECLQAIKIARATNAEPKLIAKAYARLGNAYMRKEEYDDAIEAYKWSLDEHKTAEVEKKMISAEKKKKAAEEKKQGKDDIEELLKLRDEQLQKGSNSSKKKKKKKKEKKPPVRAVKHKFCFPAYSLDIFEEPGGDDEEDDIEYEHEKKLLREYEKKLERGELNEIDTSQFPDEDDEKDDEDFDNFQKTIRREPEQSVRWKFGLEPLWISKHGKLKKGQTVPKCEQCGSHRVAELQILPTVIYQLKVDRYCHLEKNDGMDFGTVIVYTCKAKCETKDKYAKEYVLVQPPL